MWKGFGPIWTGELWDASLIGEMHKLAINDKNMSEETKSLLYKISAEASIPTVGFFDLTAMKLKQVPKISSVIEMLQNKGYKAARTHFSLTGIKTDAKESELNAILKQLKP